jgi:CheY-like chemotaxis protein
MAHAIGQGPDFSASLPSSLQPWAQASPTPCRLPVIEDEAAVRTTSLDTLRHDGYTVYAAHNGASGLEYLEREPFALVIIDIVMPQLDGLSFIKTAAQRGYCTAYIVISGYAPGIRPLRP